jgi:hypothetical protein
MGSNTALFASKFILKFCLETLRRVCLVRAVSQGKLVQNLLLKIPYAFKNSYGGTPEPQTTQDAPWLHGPSLKNKANNHIRVFCS